MSAPAPPSSAKERSPWPVLLHRALLAAVTLGTVVAALTLPNPLAVVLPAAVATGIYVVVKVPLRWSCAALVLLLLIPDTTDGSVGQWRTPLAPLGNLILQGEGLPLSGAEAIALLLAAVALHRTASGARGQTLAIGGVARVAALFMGLAVGAVAYAEVVGLAHGLPPALWKARLLVQPLLYAGLFLVAFREPADRVLIGRVVAAACFRAVLAFVIQRVAVARTGGPYDFATSHGESVLFAVAITLVMADLAVRPTRARLQRAILVVPLLVVGGISNGRRTLWVMLALIGVVAFALLPVTRWKRVLTRTAMLLVPVAGLYLWIGWENQGSLFAPAQVVRGIVDTSASRSSYWREVENWNVARSMGGRPLTGAGLGGQYAEFIPNDDISMFYKEYKEWPHNSLLGLTFLMGPFAFTAYFALLGLVSFLAYRSFWCADAPEPRVAALGCLGAVVACLVQAYGDLGLNFPQYKVLLALALAVAVRLAVTTGAWAVRAPR